jgi:replication-associated recombination protein RarA
MKFKDYTPKSVSDIVFANDRDQQLLMDIVYGKYPFPASGKNGILLYGVNGTGKSALAKLLPDAIESVKTGAVAYASFEEIEDGNNNSKIIGRIRTQSDFVPLASNHYFVLDEVDNLNKTSMASLKSVMNASGTIFIMTTNRFREIDNGVVDRCHCVPFNAAPSAKWLPFAKKMLADNRITTISDSALVSVIDSCNGSARKIIEGITRIILEVQRNTDSSTLVSDYVVLHDTK